MGNIKNFIKNESVLIISLVLCIGSAFFVKPNKDYIDYIDFNTISLLFCLMATVSGFKRLGIFKLFAAKLLNRVKSNFQLYVSLVLVCFFSSMIITNDVALITFVPFSIIALKMAKQEKKIILLVVMETIAANLGSMLTPIGNPQNLYLFSFFNMNISGFLKVIYPYSILSLVILLACSLFFGKEKISVKYDIEFESNKKLLFLYIVLFLLCLLCVFKVLNYIILFAIVVLSIVVFDKKTLASVDYSLLLTFIFLFVFIGNLGNITAVSDYLHSIVNGNEVVVGVLSSQFLSNVPATLLLSKFTTNVNSLLVGVNLGGLGTLIASMASLISYKIVAKNNIKSSKYLLVFTAFNLGYLALNMLLWIIIR